MSSNISLHEASEFYSKCECHILMVPGIRQSLTSPTSTTWWRSFRRSSMERSNWTIYAEAELAQKQGVVRFQRYGALVRLFWHKSNTPSGISVNIMIWCDVSTVSAREGCCIWPKQLLLTSLECAQIKLHYMYRKAIAIPAPFTTGRPFGITTLFLVMLHPKLSCSHWGSVLIPVG